MFGKRKASHVAQPTKIQAVEWNNGQCGLEIELSCGIPVVMALETQHLQGFRAALDEVEAMLKDKK